MLSVDVLVGVVPGGGGAGAVVVCGMRVLMLKVSSNNESFVLKLEITTKTDLR